MKVRYPWLRWTRADPDLGGVFGSHDTRELCFEEIFRRFDGASELELAVVYQLSSFFKHVLNVNGFHSPVRSSTTHTRWPCASS